MDPITTVALLLHPLLASALVVWMWWQYAWRKKSYELKGEERALHLARHETNGERLLWGTGLVILVAFAAEPSPDGTRVKTCSQRSSPARSTASWALSGSV